ncbi:hypothetical protein ABW16_11645 [Mycolicibacter heraklionensis]|uniref:MPT63-like domain-containing protein n=2 Tax=Mycolicibacter heraklionensis TaxID=512402 RepID=A0ABR5FFJ9_9MYCO|nr:hypothetical protein ABW16_11645 [Mycolicibacter heraklionensis]
MVTVAATGFAGCPTAAAFPNVGEVAGFGAALRLYADNDVIIEYTVSDLRPSSDYVGEFPRFGHLWAANLTVEAVRGTATPVLPFFNARVTTGRQAGRQYRILFQADGAEGIHPGPIPQGVKSSGKIYFDCNGAAPAVVVYNDGGQDVLTWQ